MALPGYIRLYTTNTTVSSGGIGLEGRSVSYTDNIMILPGPGRIALPNIYQCMILHDETTLKAEYWGGSK